MPASVSKKKKNYRRRVEGGRLEGRLIRYADDLVLLSRRLFFFNDAATTEIYTLSLHDALPIPAGRAHRVHRGRDRGRGVHHGPAVAGRARHADPPGVAVGRAFPVDGGRRAG